MEENEKSENIVHRRNVQRFFSGGDFSGSEDNLATEEDQGEDNSKRKLTLMEEVFLLGLKDKEGYTSFWNGSLCFGLRGCILVELGIRGRIKLEEEGVKKKSLLRRKVLITSSTPTGECLLDEALKHIRETQPPENVGSWITYLSGDSWNLLKRRYHMRHLRERIAKGLVEKGVLSTEKMNFFIFDVTTHPVLDSDAKLQLVKKVQEALLSRWNSDLSRMDKRQLSLLLLSQVSEVLENTFDSLNNDDFVNASKRVTDLANLDLVNEAAKDNSLDIMWAVIDYLSR
ncbi:Golgi phosphoprotein 3 homolog sauron [Halyomorpha halys]|uniref:Golgi phosphoprotein 3 homolog sauron n=1 Tax=Halyomorpha halys TaxID=286706 RepID=UPI0006D51D82|nr:Golgi phosphoprotein 3 homolog sauron-like [Halyomorpha halys]